MSLTAKDMVGVHLLDLVSLSNPEIASFGNTSNDAYIQWYHNNSPANSYNVGYQNQSFNICSNVPVRTSVGVGTTSANANATLHVHGTLMTSNISTYNPDNTIFFNRQNVGGINNITFAGNLYQGDELFKTSQWETVSPTNIYFPGNVGVGGTAGPNSNLFVVGDVVITGKVTAQSVLEKTQAYSQFKSVSIFSANQDGTKEIFTNSTDYINRVIFSFTLEPGRYMLTSTVPYKNLSPMFTFDTFNWAFVGLYKTTPETYSSSSIPLCTLQLNNIGSTDETDIDDINISWFIEVTESEDFVIAINGKGHTLQFGPFLQEPVRLVVVPIKSLGSGDSVDVRQKLQAKPIRKTIKINTNTFANNRMEFETDGYYNIHPSNVELFYTLNGAPTGRKLYWISPTDKEYDINEITFQNNRTTGNISLNFSPATNAILDAAIWLESTADTFFESGYLYQKFNISSAPWQMIPGGGAKLTENKCVIDGDLFVQGSIYGGCNTSSFASGGIIADYFNDFEQSINIVNTLNISDQAVTIPKLNLFVGNVGIGTSSPPERLMVMGNITPALNNTYNLGTSSLKWKDIHVDGQLISTVGTGISPFNVQSTTVVPNLNASLLEGRSVSFFRDATNMNAGILPISRGGTGVTSITNNKLLVGIGTTLTSQENLHWDSGNNRLGIGTTTPQSTLHVSGDLRIQNTTSAGVTLTVGANSGVAMSRVNDTKLQINPGSSYSDVIISGNVGIGTSSSTKPLTVKGDIRSTGSVLADIQFSGANGSASSPSYSWQSSPSTGIYSPGTNMLSVTTNSSERLRVISTGNIGVGTTNPTSKFVIYGNSERLVSSMTNVDGVDGNSTIALTMGYVNDTNLFTIQKNKAFNKSLDGDITGIPPNSVLLRNKQGNIYFQNTNCYIDKDAHIVYRNRPVLRAYCNGTGFLQLPATSGQGNIIFNEQDPNGPTAAVGSYDVVTGVYTCVLNGLYYISAKTSLQFVNPTIGSPTPVEAVMKLQHINNSSITSEVKGFGSQIRRLTNNFVGSATLHGDIIMELQTGEKLKVDVYGTGQPLLDRSDTNANCFMVIYLG